MIVQMHNLSSKKELSSGLTVIKVPISGVGRRFKLHSSHHE